MVHILALCSLLALSGQTSTGRALTPAGSFVETGGFPTNLEPSPDGRFVAVTHGGITQNLSILDATSGKVLGSLNFDGLQPGSNSKDGLYFGLRFSREPDGSLVLYAAHGAADRVDVYPVSRTGKLGASVRSYRSPRPLLGNLVPHFLSGIAVSTQGRLFAVGNQTFALSKFKGSLHVFDRGQTKPTKVVEMPAYPLDCVLLTKGVNRDKKLYVSSERDALVVVVDTETLQTTKEIRVGDVPTHLLLDSKQEKLYVSCANGDQISVVNTRTDEVIATWMVRPSEMRGLPGANPLGMSLSPNGKLLYVALSDLNAVAVLGTDSGQIRGFLPTGWYPTDVHAGSKSLIVSNAKGVKPVQPNLPPKDWSVEEQRLGDSGPNIRRNLRGGVSIIRYPSNRQLRQFTRRVIQNNHLARIEPPLPKPPPVEHVIYIIKENRTYDQMFGDLPQGNGRKDLVIYGKDITPNQRALAERFVLMDNFHVCAEMSADGWSWSTAGITSQHVQRNAQYQYSGRQRNYDFEGQNNGTPADIRGMRNVNDPPGGYLWDNALRNGVEFRNYGVYIAQGVPIRDADGRPIAEDNTPTMKAFEGRWFDDFRMYDMDYAESDCYEKHGITYPKHRKTFGSKNYKSRFEAWNDDYQRLIKEGKVPPLMLIRFGNNHTAGTTPGNMSPAAMIADNDYAVGQLVEAVSKGPLWKKTCIVIVEDDAQGGYDHVDGHRSICFVVSPWVKKSVVEKGFYNSDSALRTVEWLLGLPPTNHYTGTSRIIPVFAEEPANDAPFEAVLQDRSVYRVNTSSSYRAADSARLFHTYREESAADMELADILWGDAKGAKAPRPQARKTRRD